MATCGLQCCMFAYMPGLFCGAFRKLIFAELLCTALSFLVPFSSYTSVNLDGKFDGSNDVASRNNNDGDNVSSKPLQSAMLGSHDVQVCVHVNNNNQLQSLTVKPASMHTFMLTAMLKASEHFNYYIVLQSV
jgi:hypothetical protein